jgi:GNAT superfamily N-acetyltransferase
MHLARVAGNVRFAREDNSVRRHARAGQGGTPGRRPALRRLVGRLSANSVYMRYFGHMKELSEERARRFAEVDGQNRYALVALDPEDEGEILGVARYERERASGEEAEYAILVEDRMQGRGLGSALTRELVDGARQRGIRRLCAVILPENKSMLKLLGNLDLPEDIRWEDGVEYVTVHLYQEDAKKAS